jgi:hypothetical protein
MAVHEIIYMAIFLQYFLHFLLDKYCYKEILWDNAKVAGIAGCMPIGTTFDD